MIGGRKIGEEKKGERVHKRKGGSMVSELASWQGFMGEELPWERKTDGNRGREAGKKGKKARPLTTGGLGEEWMACTRIQGRGLTSFHLGVGEGRATKKGGGLGGFSIFITQTIA